MSINSCRLILHLQILDKSKCHPRTGHEAPYSEQRYNTTLSLTSTLEEGGWSKPRHGRFTPEKDPVPTGWAPGPVWTGVLNLAPTRIRSADHPASTKSLCRLHYPGPHVGQPELFNWNETSSF